MQSFNFHNKNGIIKCWSLNDCIGRNIHVRIDTTVDWHGDHRPCNSVVSVLCNLAHSLREPQKEIRFLYARGQWCEPRT